MNNKFMLIGVGDTGKRITDKLILDGVQANVLSILGREPVEESTDSNTHIYDDQSHDSQLRLKEWLDAKNWENYFWNGGMVIVVGELGTPLTSAFLTVQSHLHERVIYFSAMEIIPLSGNPGDDAVEHDRPKKTADYHFDFFLDSIRKEAGNPTEAIIKDIAVEHVCGASQLLLNGLDHGYKRVSTPTGDETRDLCAIAGKSLDFPQLYVGRGESAVANLLGDISTCFPDEEKSLVVSLTGNHDTINKNTDHLQTKHKGELWITQHLVEGGKQNVTALIV
jgi:hypothetical protein